MSVCEMVAQTDRLKGGGGSRTPRLCIAMRKKSGEADHGKKERVHQNSETAIHLSALPYPCPDDGTSSFVACVLSVLSFQEKCMGRLMSNVTSWFENNTEKYTLIILTAIQFTNILDFVIMMPLGPQLMRIFDITPQQFGLVVSAYTFSAGISGFGAAFFLDRFDRKRSLLALYAGFTIGTFLCSVAPTYGFLLGARIVAGTFGGIIGAVILAIVGDLIPYERRGAAMGMIMTSFSLAQVAGVPLGLFIANRFGWHMSFVFLASSAGVCWIVAARILPSIRVHLQTEFRESPIETVRALLTEAPTQRALAFMVTLIAAGFMIIPYLSPFFVTNVGRSESDLPYIYFFGGLATIVSSRLIGRMSDKYGKLVVFVLLAAASVLPILMVTNLPRVSLPVAIICLTVFMVLVSGRGVPSMAMVTAAVHPSRRGSFMSISASMQQFSAGIASFAGGLIIGKSSDGSLTGFGIVGLIATAATIMCIVLARRLRFVEETLPQARPQPVPVERVESQDPLFDGQDALGK
jgi:predicted MFS family arabinose efflux permease